MTVILPWKLVLKQTARGLMGPELFAVKWVQNWSRSNGSKCCLHPADFEEPGSPCSGGRKTSPTTSCLAVNDYFLSSSSRLRETLQQSRNFGILSVVSSGNSRRSQVRQQCQGGHLDRPGFVKIITRTNQTGLYDRDTCRHRSLCRYKSPQKQLIRFHTSMLAFGSFGRPTPRPRQVSVGHTPAILWSQNLVP